MTRDTHRAGEEIVKAPSEQVGKEFQSVKLTLVGAAPHVVSFRALGLQNMANVNYVAFVDGETAARVTVDESTITTEGFSILGGAATEVVHILVHGAIATRR